MFKKVVALLMTCVLSMSLVGCSNSNSSDKTTTKKPATSNSIKIKDVNDFQEADGLIKYFTIDDKKIAIPETVGEYANYLSQVGTVTLNDTGDKVEDVELDANGISSMAAYLNVELDSGDEAHFYLRYENPTKKAISVAEASVTFIEVKYDEYAEEDDSSGVPEPYRRDNHVLAVDRKGNQTDCYTPNQERTKNVVRKRCGTGIDRCRHRLPCQCGIRS